MTRLVLVHGAASTPRVWDRLIPYLGHCEVLAPERPRTGDLDLELEWLSGLVAGAWVVGLSGGATLGLALAARGGAFAGAVLHEPAVGSLVPGLLAPMRTAFAAGGTAAFARTLYGPSWSVELCGTGAWLDDEVTARELSMFATFEPGGARADGPPVVITLGGDSPPPRRRAADALRDQLGYAVREVPCASHFAPHDAPETFARVLAEIISTSATPSPSGPASPT
jgi:pimeloyl-ACP methyl ester carboxylesterase